MTDTALLLVDLQNDFMPDGALPAAGGDAVPPVANRLMDSFELVVASQDWHPPDHGSFASNHADAQPGEVIDLDGLDQILWPDHCVQETEGAEFVPELNTGGIDRVFHKGTDPSIDSYSAFFDNGHRKATGMGEFLNERGIERLFVAGVATDYCVKYSVLDSCRRLDLETWVVVDGCAGVENQPGDIDRAFAEMRDAGATLVDSGIVERMMSDS
jgi:nicotinamidase/pyrazinamidase